MKLLQVAEENRRYYSDEFVLGFNTGARVQYTTDKKGKQGRWIESEIENEKYVCSVCGGSCWYYDYQGDVAKSNYCPNCGAKMEADE